MAAIRTWLGSVFLLTACATTEGYEARLATWVGQPTSNLVARWGVPARTLTLPSGETVYEYTSSAASATSHQFGTTTVTSVNDYWCTTDFYVVGDKVTKTSWQGNNCLAD